ncbi:hypothetical protein [Amycolatopsis sp. w19]|uniref:hypothetical protein n=1 Tax=Amycolatopsis sp. w19 TaxID=3448134 RepID=UPI003F1A6EA0
MFSRDRQDRGPTPSELARRVDVSQSEGVQVGDHNTQNNTYVVIHPEGNGVVPPARDDEAISDTVDRNYRRNRITRPPVMAAHPGASLLADRLTADDGRPVVVMHGRAGSGKSTVAAEAVKQLTEAGWTAAVVRMDAVDRVCRNAAALGKAADLRSSPVDVLATAAGGGPTVLVIDQLDAVSTYSGRIPDSYHAVAEAVEQASRHGRMKVVLVVRTADLLDDPRMRFLLLDEDKVEQLEVGDLDATAVRAALAEFSVDATSLAADTFDLLRVPLHLAVFFRLEAKSRELPYRTLPDLYRQFTGQLRSLVEGDLGAAGWHGAIAPLVTYMSEHETLHAPAALLDRLPQRARPALASAGILRDDGDTVQFFHETYFDFLFAQEFVAQGQDLHDFVVNSGQQLFRRAQLRQVLEHLIGVNRRRFRTDAVRLLTSDAIRSNLLDVVIGVLSSLPAAADDWLAIEPFAFSGSRRSGRLLALLMEPAWFDAADSAGRWEPLLAETATATPTANVLIRAARERGKRVAELVKPFIGSSDEWTLRLRSMVEWFLSPSLVDLTVELLRRGLLDGARGPIAVNSNFWSIIAGLHDEDPAGAARVVGAYLNRARERAQADDVANPFPDYIDQAGGAGGDKTIVEIATAAPQQYLEHVLPFVLTVLDDTATDADGERKAGSPWAYRFYRSHQVTAAVLDGVDIALRATAHDLWSSSSSIIPTLRSSDHEVARFLACRAYAVIAEQAADEAIDWLRSDDRNLKLGWQGSNVWASRLLIEAATPHCGDAQLEALGTKLLAYYPAWEKKPGRNGAWGCTQYVLMSALSESRLSPAVRRRLGELERKFTRAVIRPPEPVEAHFVGPPVPEKAGEHMTNEDWLRAIAKYSSREELARRNFAVGGSRELAQLLGRRATIEPQRFTELALTFDEQMPTSNIIEVVNAVAGKITTAELTELCEHARHIVGEAAGQAVCRAIANSAEEATDALIDLVEHYARAADPAVERAGGRPDDDFELATEGMNSTRGVAAATIGQILAAEATYGPRLLPVVAELAQDPILSVRAEAARPSLALFASHLEQALDIADALFSTSAIEIHYSNPANELLLQAIFDAGPRFARHLNHALETDSPIAVRAGHIWANALLNDRLPEACPSDVTDLPILARQGAAQTMATAPHLAATELVRLFDDGDPDVRKAASVAIRVLHEPASASISERVVVAYATSRAFPDNFGDLFHALEQSLRLLPSTTIIACERAVEHAGVELGDLSRATAAISCDIVTVVLRLYRQGDAAMRDRCLNVVDKLADVGAYGLPEALQHER